MPTQGRQFYAGVDIGGTFTDVILAEHETQKLYTSKKLTTPEEPSRGVMTALRDAMSRRVPGPRASSA